jgi:hypothetical protein
LPWQVYLLLNTPAFAGRNNRDMLGSHQTVAEANSPIMEISPPRVGDDAHPRTALAGLRRELAKPLGLCPPSIAICDFVAYFTDAMHFRKYDPPFRTGVMIVTVILVVQTISMEQQPAIRLLTALAQPVPVER